QAFLSGAYRLRFFPLATIETHTPTSPSATFSPVRLRLRCRLQPLSDRPLPPARAVIQTQESLLRPHPHCVAKCSFASPSRFCQSGRHVTAGVLARGEFRVNW